MDSSIWRVEVHAGKRHLKDRWAISTWPQFYARFGDVIVSALESVRYSLPTNDANRARWPLHDLWVASRHEVVTDLFEMRNCADPDLLKRVQRI